MILGIDVGTSKVAAAIVDEKGDACAVASREHNASVHLPDALAEQDPALIRECVVSVVQSLPPDLRREVEAVGITGQMHGVLLLDASGQPRTNLITWQDQRCLQEASFLADLGKKTGHRLRTGYGCATLAWLHMHNRVAERARAASTIYDWIGTCITGESRPAIDPTGAQSWGLLDITRQLWDDEALRAIGLPVEILPEVIRSGSLAGRAAPRRAEELGIPDGVPIAIGLGDTQASMMATLRDPDKELSLTLGTGGQLSAVTSAPVPANEGPADEKARFEVWPFPGERFAIVAASLCGGSAWAWLQRTVVSLLRDFGAREPEEEWIYSRINELGAAGQDLLDISPHFLGERYDPGLRAEIRGIDTANFSTGNVARALARGIIGNLKGMLPAGVLASRSRTVGSGNALRKNPLLQKAAEEVLGLPMVLSRFREEAAVGAAMNAAGLLARRTQLPGPPGLT